VPKIGTAKCLDRDKHQAGIEELLNTIAKLHNKRRGDVVIAYEEDISVYAIRMWLNRPVPQRHWKTLARLSNFSITKIGKIARGCFEMAAID
jgi:hypothetical protein